MDEPLTFEVVSEGIVAPLTSLEWGERGSPGIFDGGAYYGDGTVCARSLQRKAGFTNQPRPLITLAGVSRIPGAHLYAGMLKNEHFGHFVAESLSRLWPLAESAARDVESVVFYPRMLRQPIPQWASDFISILEPGIPLRIVSDATIFESLIVPDQAAHSSNGFVYGHPAIRELFARLRRIQGKRFKKLYVSRSKLPNSGGILGEKRLEEILTREGFDVMHPQEHSLSEQIAFYNGAQTLVFAEGAALHLFALTCRPDQRVYIIQRRKNASIFHWQLRSFGLSPIIGPEAPSAYYIPQDHGRSTLLARARINFEKLRDQLVAEGMARGSEWDLPDERLINEEIHCIEKHMGQRLVEHSSDSM
jgi:hypothetical protein